jgi:hypothetical protein
MSFLTPLYLAGALFVALPIIFHLIRRTPRDRMPFSTLMFLRESPPRVTRRSRLENILLLLLRATALVLLAIAFARPFLREAFRAQADSGDARVIAIGLDTSASMRRDDLWQQAAARASTVVAGLRPVDHAMIFTFDRRNQTILSFDDWLEIPSADRANRARSLLQNIHPSWDSTSLGSALAAAADAVEVHAASIAGSGSSPDQSVLLISDLQKGCDLTGLRQYDWPDSVSLEVAAVRTPRSTNASIQWVEERDESKDARDRDSVRVRVANAAESKQDRFRLVWQELDESGVDAYVLPGRARLLQLPRPVASDSPAQLALTGDEHEFDNRLYIVPRQPERISILYIGAGRVLDTLFYLQRAFPESVSRSVEVTAHDRADRLDLSNLASVRFTVLADSVVPETIASLREFVATGGTLLGVLTDAAAAESIGRVMGIDHWNVEEASLREYAMLGEIDFQHPLFAPFSDPRYSDFTKIHFWHHRKIDLSPLENARVIARFDDHDPALVEVPCGAGRVLILTAGWHPADSQLAVSSKFVPLLGAMLDHSLGTREPTTSVRVNDPVPIAEAGTVTRLTRPDGAEIELPVGTIEFRDTDVPGVYLVDSGGKVSRFAVNINPAESQTDPLPIEELEQFGVRLTATKSSSRIVADAARQRQMHGFELESRQKLWRWLLIAVLGVLLIESWLAGRPRVVSSRAS